MVVIPHTMAVCLTHSMQAPGLFVPGLCACKEQGLFNIFTGSEKTSCSHIHAPQQRRVFTYTLHKLQSTAPETSILPFFLSFFLSFFFPLSVCLSHSALRHSLSFLPSRCMSIPEASFTFRKQQKVKQVWMSRRAAVPRPRNFCFIFFFFFFFFFFLLFQ